MCNGLKSMISPCIVLTPDLSLGLKNSIINWALATNDVLFSFLSMIRTNLYNEKLTNA